MEPNKVHAGFTACFSKAGLTGITGGATTFSTGSGGVTFAIRGKAYTKAQVSGGTTPTTDASDGGPITLVKNQARAVVWCLDASGNVKVAAGPAVPLDASGAYFAPPQFPSIPVDLCPFAYTIHKAGSTLSGTFTFGVSNWGTTGMSHTVVDVCVLPDRPHV